MDFFFHFFSQICSTKLCTFFHFTHFSLGFHTQQENFNLKLTRTMRRFSIIKKIFLGKNQEYFSSRLDFNEHQSSDCQSEDNFNQIGQLASAPIKFRDRKRWRMLSDSLSFSRSQLCLTPLQPGFFFFESGKIRKFQISLIFILWTPLSLHFSSKFHFFYTNFPKVFQFFTIFLSFSNNTFFFSSSFILIFTTTKSTFSFLNSFWLTNSLFFSHLSFKLNRTIRKTYW